jgi:F-type H+-transporting ATPase subunit a
MGKVLSGIPKIVWVVLVALLLLGFLVGPFGALILGGIGFKPPEFLSPPLPNPRLPAEVLFMLGPLPVTNTIVTGWMTTIFLVVVSIVATRRMKLVPTGLQNFIEIVVEFILRFCEDVAGKENGRRFFPLVATILLFVVTNAWFNLLPGFGTIVLHGTEGEIPILRGANTDLNVPLALALISFVAVEYWGISTLGFLTYVTRFLNFRRLFSGIGQLFTGKIRAGVSSILNGLTDVFVGGLELLSEFIRIISFTFRLFGNMTGGEILILVLIYLVPYVLPSAAYVFETVIGLVQGFVFAALTLVFANLAVTQSHEEH